MAIIGSDPLRRMALALGQALRVDTEQRGPRARTTGPRLVLSRPTAYRARRSDGCLLSRNLLRRNVRIVREPLLHHLGAGHSRLDIGYRLLGSSRSLAELLGCRLDVPEEATLPELSQESASLIYRVPVEYHPGIGELTTGLECDNYLLACH
jgi:hypothetical protein